MSMYEDFNRCIVCRSAKNLEDYHGKFEVTMLLNTLYITVMQSIENRKNLHIKSSKISNWLLDNGIINNCGNEFNSDDYIRYLRNGLAHFNIQVEDKVEGGSRIIDKVLISAKNQEAKSMCKMTCEVPKCIPKQFKIENESICIFVFTTDQLRLFTLFMIEYVLQVLPNDKCYKCGYKEEYNVNSNF